MIFMPQKIQTLNEQCQQFSGLSNGLIRADIKKSLDVASLKQKFKTAFASLNVKEQKIERSLPMRFNCCRPYGANGTESSQT